MRFEPSFFAMLLATLAAISGSPSSTALSRINQDRGQAAQELGAVVLEDYARAKDRMSEMMRGPSIYFTVAARRYDSAYAVVGLAIHTDNASLPGRVGSLEFTVQPIELSATQVVRTIGTLSTGTAKAGTGPSPGQGLLHHLSFPTRVPEDANALLLQMTFNSIHRSLKFIISVGAEIRAGTGAIAYPTTLGATNQPASAFRPASFAGNVRQPHATQINTECSCSSVGIDCTNGCSETHDCNLCNHPATIGCTDTGCFILCDSPSGCS